MDTAKALSWIPLKRFREPPPIVGVLRLSGVIGMRSLRGGLSMASLAEPIERAFKLPRLAAVALQINSPGGSPVQSTLIAKRIRDLAKEKQVPVLAFCEDVAASGGYWLACAADEIFAQETSVVGSIGVISSGFGFQEAMTKLGVERRLYTAGEKKSLLDPFKPVEAADVERLKHLQEEIHEVFKAHVRASRGERLSGDAKEVFSGAFWSGRGARELGLIDGVADLREETRRRFGVNCKLKLVAPSRGPFPRRLGVIPGSWNGLSEDIALSLGENFLSALEERALWGRYGL
jgi:signal peptide peptidase SppA